MGALGSSLPQAGRAGKGEPGTQGRGEVAGARCAPPQSSLGSWAAKVRVAWPGALQASLFPLLHPQPVSSLGAPAQHWPPRALCCTYSRLVFIPCENDILFLLSVSVFMCEELLACCACARGELVPGDWRPNAPSPALAWGCWPRGSWLLRGTCPSPDPLPPLFQL